MNRDTLRQSANAASVLLALVVNVLSNALPLNGQNTGAISDRFDVYFVPAGYVFAIWGVLYIGWLAFVVYQFMPAQRQNPRLRRLGYWFALSGVLNAAWLFCWHWNQFGLSVLVMLALLGTLIMSYLRLNVGRSTVGRAEQWCVDIPFGAYLGWISVATIANVTSFLDFVEWNGAGIAPQAWAAIMLAVATVLGLLLSWLRRDAAYVLVLAWAFAGIALKHAGVAVVSSAAWAATVIALVLAARNMLAPRRHPL